MKKLCTMCGKQIAKMDLECNPFTIHNEIGYGSVHDGDTLNVRLCNHCEDTLITYLIEHCKVSPLIEKE